MLKDGDGSSIQVVADQRGHRRERARPIRPRVVGQADEHKLARAGRLTAAVGRDRGKVETSSVNPRTPTILMDVAIWLG